MPMTSKQYSDLKKNLSLWFLVEEQGVDNAALWSMFAECRNALQHLIDVAEEANPPSLWSRFVAVLRGA
jgi:hypothetical protein